ALGGRLGHGVPRPETGRRDAAVDPARPRDRGYPGARAPSVGAGAHACSGATLTCPPEVSAGSRGAGQAARGVRLHGADPQPGAGPLPTARRRTTIRRCLRTVPFSLSAMASLWTSVPLAGRSVHFERLRALRTE